MLSVINPVTGLASESYEIPLVISSFRSAVEFAFGASSEESKHHAIKSLIEHIMGVDEHLTICDIPTSDFFDVLYQNSGCTGGDISFPERALIQIAHRYIHIDEISLTAKRLSVLGKPHDKYGTFIQLSQYAMSGNPSYLPEDVLL